MLKWLITLVVALVLFSGLQRTLSKIGLGQLPGDFTLRLFGRELPVPLTSTLLLSGLFALLSYLI